MPKGIKRDGTKLGFQKGHKFSPGGKPKEIDTALLIKRYVIDKVSTYALQQEFGITNNAIRQRLIKMGIKLRGWRDAQLLIPHESPIEKIGFNRWYEITQSKQARLKRSIAHTGKKFTEERKQHMRDGIGRGRDNKSYLGEIAGYKAKHLWFNNNLVKTGICSYCKSQPKPKGRIKIATHWANLDWLYNREDKKTWVELCPNCNFTYDKDYNFRINLVRTLGIKGIKIPLPNQKNPFTSKLST